jgi:hypothetical protein
MSTKSLVAFAVGTALFTLAPLFDPILPDDRPDAGLPVWIALVGAVAVGALVVLIAGSEARRAWLLAVAGAFVASLLSLVHVAAPGPPLLPDDFGVAYATFNVLYFFALTGPLAAVGGLVAGLALALVPPLRLRHTPRSGRG